MSTQIDRPTDLATMDLDQGGESRLRNPLREICTVGSVRGENPSEPRWTYTGTKLETADTAKGNLPLTGLLYSENRW